MREYTQKDAEIHWKNVQPAVTKLTEEITTLAALLLGIGVVETPIGPLLPTVIGDLYSQFVNSQQGKGDEVVAEGIVSDTSALVQRMLDRVEDDLERYFQDMQIRSTLTAIKVNHDKTKEWLSVKNGLFHDPTLTDKETEMAVQCAYTTIETRATTENVLEEALKRKDGAQALLLYKHLIDLVQLECQIKAITGAITHQADVDDVLGKINKLIEEHEQVIALVRDVLNQQFFGPVKIVTLADPDTPVTLPLPVPPEHPTHPPTVTTYTYYYQSDAVDMSNLEAHQAWKVADSMRVAMMAEVGQQTESIAELKQEHVYALYRIKQLPPKSG